MTNGWWEMGRDVRGVRERGADLVKAQGILGSHGVSGFASREGADDRGDVDAGAAEARLSEANVKSIETPGKTFIATTLTPAA